MNSTKGGDRTKFKVATDELTRPVSLSLSRIADRFGMSLNSVSRMRSGRGERNVLRPPESWPRTLADLARENARELEQRAKELRDLAERWEGEG